MKTIDPTFKLTGGIITKRNVAIDKFSIYSPTDLEQSQNEEKLISNLSIKLEQMATLQSEIVLMQEELQKMVKGKQKTKTK